MSDTDHEGDSVLSLPTDPKSDNDELLIDADQLSTKQEINIKLPIEDDERRLSNVSSIGSWEISPRILIEGKQPRKDIVETKTYKLKLRTNSELARSIQHNAAEPSRRPKKRVRLLAKPIINSQRLSSPSPSGSSRSSSRSRVSTFDEKKSNLRRIRRQRPPRKIVSVKKKSKKNNLKPTVVTLNIAIDNVQFEPNDKTPDGCLTSGDEDLQPPPNLSPRSQAEYARIALKRAADKRKLKKRKKKKITFHEDNENKKKKKGKKKRKKKKKRKRRNEDESDTDDEELDKNAVKRKTIQSSGEHFYPPPRGLRRRRCPFVAEHKAVKCSICNGIHYRTKRSFASNLKVIINVNRALMRVLGDMRKGIHKIDANLYRVKKNLEFMEDMYDNIFRKVNRLIA